MALYRLLSILIILSVVHEAAAAKKKAPAEEPSRRRDVTTLRAGVPSYVLSGKSGQREVRYLSVQVTNIGDVSANDVVVSLPAAQGLSFPLRGPKKLGPRARAVYVSTVRVPSGVTLRGYALTTCSTCRR
ncbi:MAG: hypothetical protein RL518_2698 [Pseudomonadota bacterium]|jgi:hypothetical protein